MLSLQMWHTTQVASALPLALLLLLGFEPAVSSPGVRNLWSCVLPCSGGEQDSSREKLTGLLPGPGWNAACN